MIVLNYIRNESRCFQTYVTNRVTEIRELTFPHQWRHYPDAINPADDASRGLRIEEFLRGSSGFLIELPCFQNKQSLYWICGKNQHKAHQCAQQSTAPKRKSPDICRNFNKFFSATCEQSNNKYSGGRLHKCQKWDCKAIHHTEQRILLLVTGLAASNKQAAEKTTTEYQENFVWPTS